MNRSNKQSITINRFFAQFNYSRGKIFSFLIVAALLAFEIFNYSTTDFALNDLLGGLRFLSIRWATILAIAFCGIDFAGIARLFTPQRGCNQSKEVWYLLGAWLLAASMNAMLTWWGVSLAIINHESLGGMVIDRETLVDIVPIFVAIMVWLIRVLIIGTFSVSGDRLYSQADRSTYAKHSSMLGTTDVPSKTPLTQPLKFHPVIKTQHTVEHQPIDHPEPTYHPASMSGYKSGINQTRR